MSKSHKVALMVALLVLAACCMLANLTIVQHESYRKSQVAWIGRSDYPIIGTAYAINDDSPGMMTDLYVSNGTQPTSQLFYHEWRQEYDCRRSLVRQISFSLCINDNGAWEVTRIDLCGYHLGGG